MTSRVVQIRWQAINIQGGEVTAAWLSIPIWTHRSLPTASMLGKLKCPQEKTRLSPKIFFSSWWDRAVSEIWNLEYSEEEKKITWCSNLGMLRMPQYIEKTSHWWDMIISKEIRMKDVLNPFENLSAMHICHW